MNTDIAKTFSPQDLHAEITRGTGPLLLDVREYPEFAAGHLANARLLPLATLETGATDLPPDRRIVCVCRSGKRSAEAATTLRRLGFANVAQLTGGMTAWEAAGLPIEKEARVPWALERQVRLVAGLLTLLGLALSHIWPPAIALAWFIPLGLVFAALTDWCGMGLLLAKMPWNRAASAGTA